MPDRLRRVGLFGGTFNPVHSGHLHIATEIREHFSLDSIIFIPAGTPPHKEKEGLIDQVHRLQMVELATAPYKYFTVSTVEVEHSGVSYSVNTVKAVQGQVGDTAELYFIAGIDAFLDFNTWKDTEELLTLCNFIVIPRPGYRFTDLKGVKIPSLPDIPLTDLERLEMGEVSRLTIPLTERYSLFLERITPCGISSTELRRIIRAGKEFKNQLPETVALYIMENRLYN